jgi:hypothetical protein
VLDPRNRACLQSTGGFAYAGFMPLPTLLVASWLDGLFVVAGGKISHEISGTPVRGLAPNQGGGVLAIVGGHSLRQRDSAGEWRTLATSATALSCCVDVRNTIYVGTDDAQVLRLAEGDGERTLEPLSGFANMPGRDKWYAGAALVNGKLLGPPLGVRSMTATCDGSAILANVHVGGIARSTDGGVTWQPTIAIDDDVHQVCAHASRSETVIAAAARGLCISRDGGATWSVDQEGLHASYCSAVAFAGDEIFVAASEDHFSARGGMYQRALEETGPLQPVAGGLPRWLDGIVDTACIAALDAALAVTDRRGNVYLSQDAGHTWRRVAEGLPNPSSLLILPADAP